MVPFRSSEKKFSTKNNIKQRNQNDERKKIARTRVFLFL
jgi:hypothetical protein